MLRSLGFGLGLETFAKFLMISVSVLKNLVSEKKSRYRFRSKFWYRHSVHIDFPNQNCHLVFHRTKDQTTDGSGGCYSLKVSQAALKVLQVSILPLILSHPYNFPAVSNPQSSLFSSFFFVIFRFFLLQKRYYAKTFPDLAFPKQKFTRSNLTYNLLINFYNFSVSFIFSLLSCDNQWTPVVTILGTNFNSPLICRRGTGSIG